MPEEHYLFNDPIAGPLYTWMCALIAAIFGGALTRRTESRLWTAIIAIYTASMALLAVGSLFELRRIEREQSTESLEEADPDA